MLAIVWFSPIASAQMRSSQNVVEVSHHWSVQQVAPGDQAVLAVVLDIDPAWHLKPDASQLKAQDQYLIPTELALVKADDGLLVQNAVYPKAREDIPVKLAGEASMTSGYVARTVLWLPVNVSPQATPGQTYGLEAAVTIQACDEASCLAPSTVNISTTLKVADPTVAVTGDAAELFAQFDHGQIPPGPPPTQAALKADDAASLAVLTVSGLAYWLVLAFFGGVLLNVMPCVLPVIPIKILSLVQAAPDAGRRMRLGLAMCLGVLCFWAVLGVLIAAVSGVQGISALFANWWFNIGLGIFIVVLAVGMCGLFSIQLPRWVYAINPKHDSYPGSFGFGVMTAVLATPCTGPFLGGAAGAVLTAGALPAFLIFTFIGLGMALPYLILSMYPNLVNRMPRTGPASELVKQVLGLLMLSAGAFFIGAGVNSFLSDGSKGVYQWYWWVVAGLIAVAGLWMIIRTFQIARTPTTKITFTAIGLVMALAAIGTAYETTRPSEIPWVYYTPRHFENAVAQGKVVLIDFTADWCINCKFLERSVLETSSVIRALNSDDVVAMKVDLTGTNPDGWAKLNAVNRVAIPLLVVFDRAGREVFKQEVYTAGQVVEALQTARDQPLARQ